MSCINNTYCSCCNCNTCICNNTPTTTTTTTIYVTPCEVDNCEQIELVDCVKYSTESNCLGISLTDSFKDVVKILFKNATGISCDECSTVCLVTYVDENPTENSAYNPFASYKAAFVSKFNNLPVYEFDVEGNTLVLFWTGFRWQIRRNNVNGELIAYLDVDYNIGDPIPDLNNQDDWVIINSILENTNVFMTNFGCCCNCITMQFFKPLYFDYTGTYVDCNGETQNWSTENYQGQLTISLCTSELQSLVFTLPEEKEPLFSIDNCLKVTNNNTVTFTCQSNL